MSNGTRTLWELLEGEEYSVVYGAGDTILREGDVGTSMHVVLSGAVDVHHAGQPLERLGVGGLFGELALIDGEPRGASARAAEVCSLAIIGRRRFEALLTESSAFALEVMRVTADRLRRRTSDGARLAGFLRESRVPATFAPLEDSDHSAAKGADDDARRRERFLREVRSRGTGRRSVRAGERVFEEGEPGDEMYVVAAGAVEIRIGDRLLESLAAGGVFGELSVVEPAARSATAEAVADTELIAVGRERFQLLAHFSPPFALEVLRVMADRLRLRTQDCGRLAAIIRAGL